jgi:galactokinase
LAKLVTSAPGRICFYGEHQDYLELAVIPAAITMRTTIEGETNQTGKIAVNALDLNLKDEFPSNGLVPYISGPLDYFRAVVNVFFKKQLLKQKIGINCRVKSQIPLKSGLSSSAAILVAWAKFLAEALKIPLTDEEIGYFAYLAEHNEMKIPCGMMDQLACSLGNIFHMVCTTPPKITRLSEKIPGIVIGNTMIPKSTNSVHGVRVREINDAITEMKKFVNFELKTVKYSEIESFLPRLTQIHQKRLRAVIKNRDITQRAYNELQKKSPNVEYLGKLLNDHQTYLRDDFEVSHPKIEKMLEAGRIAGALGGKLTGAGMGGCIVMIAPGRQKEVAAALKAAGGDPYIVEIDEGARRDN